MNLALPQSISVGKGDQEMSVDDNRAVPPLGDDPGALSALMSQESLMSWATQAPQWDRENSFARNAIRELASTGVMGATFSVQDGGQGASLRQVLEAVRLASLYTGVLGRVIVDSNLGPAAMIATYGNGAMRHEVLAATRNGNKPAIAITEPDAGSAASDLTTSVLRDSTGKLSLTGQKKWITGAPESSHYVVFARFDATPGSRGIGLVLARKQQLGIEFGVAPRMMGMRGLPEGSISFDNYSLSEDDIILPPGDGFKRGMEIYNSQRLGAAMVACSVAESALNMAVEYARSRRQFDRPIGDNQGLRWMLADMAIDVETALAYLRRVADDADRSGNRFSPNPVEVAMAKIKSAEMAIRVTNGALQVFGARGYDTEQPVERLCRDARMFTIAGGTAEMLRNLVGKAVLSDVTPRGLYR